VNGEDLSLPKYDPFWAKAAELGVLVFMHPGGAENIVKEGAFRGVPRGGTASPGGRGRREPGRVWH
jgi:predicted TIM-barrel fold metal-dependent hydrolase